MKEVKGKRCRKRKTKRRKGTGMKGWKNEQMLKRNG